MSSKMLGVGTRGYLSTHSSASMSDRGGRFGEENCGGDFSAAVVQSTIATRRAVQFR